MNQLSTAGYMVHRLRGAGFVVWKIFNSYSEGDARKWTILVDPGHASVYITCYYNADMIDGYSFRLDDDGSSFNNVFVQTDSTEVIIKTLTDRGVSNNPKLNKFYKE